MKFFSNFVFFRFRNIVKIYIFIRGSEDFFLEKLNNIKGKRKICCYYLEKFFDLFFYGEV